MAVDSQPIPVETAPPPRTWRWYHVAWSVVFILFCLELGVFLLMFPWTEYWDNNYFSTMAPGWRRFWGNAYVRGGVSGLGIVNLYISIAEIFRLRRFSRP